MFLTEVMFFLSVQKSSKLIEYLLDSISEL